MPIDKQILLTLLRMEFYGNEASFDKIAAVERFYRHVITVIPRKNLRIEEEVAKQ